MGFGIFLAFQGGKQVGELPGDLLAGAGLKTALVGTVAAVLEAQKGGHVTENGVCVAVRRDNGEKIIVNLDELETKIPELLKAVQDGLYNKALERRENMTYDAHNLDEMKEIADNKPGFIRAMWCGDRECEDKLKEFAGVTSRCIPFDGEEQLSDTCVCCGKPAKHMLYWGKAY